MHTHFEQNSVTLTLATLLKTARAMREREYRLVQICATRLAEELQLTYSFDRDGELVNFRLNLPAAQTRIPSISAAYWCAFLYENELQDLFGLQVDGLVVDFHGSFYKTAVRFPFGIAKAPRITTPTLPVPGRGNGKPDPAAPPLNPPPPTLNN